MWQQTAANAMANATAPVVPAALATSRAVQFVTASIEYHSLATTMSRLNDDSDSNLEKGTQPKWDFKHETYVDWQHKEEIWAESHDIRHLLGHPPVAALTELR